MNKQEIQSSNTNGEPREHASSFVHETVFDLVKRFLPEKNCKILDLGAGEGAFSRRLAKAGYEIIAADPSPDYFKTPEIPLRIADLDADFAAEVSPDGEKFDAIVAIEIIEHIENPFAFLRQCAKLLKKDGLLFVTSPNVESITSRIVFLYTGRLRFFGEGETLRPAHITPLFKWKFDIALAEANLEYVWEGYNRRTYYVGEHFHNKIGSLMAMAARPFVKGERDGETRIIVARLAKQ